MISRSDRAQVERILRYISKREKAVWKLTTDESDDLRVAWWTIWFAAYQDAERPHDAALRKVLGPRYQTYQKTHNTLPALYTGSGEDLHELDGRSAAQWVRSVLTYLDWRSGDCWRSLADRNHSERRAYTEASLQLRQAFFNTPTRPPERFQSVTKPTHAVELIAPIAATVTPKPRAR